MEKPFRCFMLLISKALPVRLIPHHTTHHVACGKRQVYFVVHLFFYSNDGANVKEENNTSQVTASNKNAKHLPAIAKTLVNKGLQQRKCFLQITAGNRSSYFPLMMFFTSCSAEARFFFCSSSSSAVSALASAACRPRCSTFPFSVS